MSVRWIHQHIDGRLERGAGDPPITAPGTLHFVGETEDESAAIIDGRLFRRGQQAAPGRHRIKLKNGTTAVFDVDGTGRARGQIEKGGAQANGSSR